jgi:hypothetical protein
MPNHEAPSTPGGYQLAGVRLAGWRVVFAAAGVVVVGRLRLPCPTESQEGEILVAYLRVRGLAFTHIANETGHSPEALRRAIRVKRQGTSRGFPDYIIALPGIGLLIIELKRQRGSVTSQEQKDWVAVLNECPGTAAHICKGGAAAIAVIESYCPRGVAAQF